MDQNEGIRNVTLISDETGVSFVMIRYLLSTLLDGFKHSKTLDPDAVVHRLIQNLIETEQSVEKTLEHNGIHSSSDIGRVIMALCEHGLLIKEKHDSFEAFENIFTTTGIDQYIKKEGLKKRKMWSNWIGSILIAIGVILIIGSNKELFQIDLSSWGWIIMLIACIIIFLGNLSKKAKLMVTKRKP